MNQNNFERFQEPEEPKVVAVDWQGEAIYKGDEFVRTELGLVLFEDLESYLRSNRLVEVAGDE